MGGTGVEEEEKRGAVRGIGIEIERRVEREIERGAARGIGVEIEKGVEREIGRGVGVRKGGKGIEREGEIERGVGVCERGRGGLGGRGTERGRGTEGVGVRGRWMLRGIEVRVARKERGTGRGVV